MRSVQWGHWGITFIKRGKPIAKVMFPVGTGPCDGTVGSPERQRYIDMVAAWRASETIPYGATLYDNGSSLPMGPSDFVVESR